MLLGVDIGNTTISVAVFKAGKITRKVSFSTDRMRGFAPRWEAVLRDVKTALPDLNSAVICSVVPKAVAPVKRGIKKVLGSTADIKVVGKDLTVPIRNQYHRPNEVGQDRLLCAFAAKSLYGSPALVIDFGTAITFDVVSCSGAYLGGVIIPGIRLSLESLFANTALLPRVQDLKAPRNLIGKSTRESILSGIFHGYGSMCAGLIEQFGLQIKQEPKVIVTGGHTRLMKKYIHSQIDQIDDSLVFKGMYLLYKSA